MLNVIITIASLIPNAGVDFLGPIIMYSELKSQNIYSDKNAKL